MSSIYLVLGVAFLGLRAGDVNWAGVALIVPLSAFAMLGIGVLAAAATVVFKRGGSVVTVAVFGMTFISGALFPISLLPDLAAADRAGDADGGGPRRAPGRRCTAAETCGRRR